jgi:hypothetical protein
VKTPGTAARHGTRRRYDLGCRCVACTAHRSAYDRARRVPRVRTDVHEPSHSLYTNGCRCQPCREAHRQWCRQIRADRAGKLPADDPRHGTRVAWDHWGCRCDRCTSTHRRLHRDYYVRATS